MKTKRSWSRCVIYAFLALTSSGWALCQSAESTTPEPQGIESDVTGSRGNESEIDDSQVAASGRSDAAQRRDQRRFELFGGVSALGWQTPYTRNVEGWHGGITFALWDQLGVSFQSAGYYYGGERDYGCGSGVVRCSFARDSYDIFVGPVFRPAFLRRYRLRPFIHGMVGGVYVAGHTFDYLPVFDQTIQLYSRELRPALGLGGGIDIAVAERLHIRLIQLDSVHRYGTRLWLFADKMVRPSAGIVVRF